MRIFLPATGAHSRRQGPDRMTRIGDIRAVLAARTPGLPTWMIHHANNIRPKGAIKVGGHQASSASMNTVDHDGPTLSLCYTVKGHGLKLVGHKDNHAGILPTGQVEGLRQSIDIAEGAEWEWLAGLGPMRVAVEAHLAAVAFARAPRPAATSVPVQAPAGLTFKKRIATQEAFGRLLSAIASGAPDLAERIVTTSPDVSVSANLGPRINKTGLSRGDRNRRGRLSPARN